MNYANKKMSFYDIFTISLPTKNYKRIFQFHWLIYSKTLVQSTLKLMTEPLVVLLVFGYGVGQLLLQEKIADYFNFVLIGLIPFSLAHACFIGMINHLRDEKEVYRSFEMFKNSAVTTKDVAYGELVWVMFKGLIQVLPLLILAASRGVFEFVHLPFVLLVVVFMGLVMSSLGLLIVSVNAGDSQKSFISTAMIMPIMLLSGVFFPVTFMPKTFEFFINISPVYHGQLILRAVSEVNVTSKAFISLAVLFAMAVVLVNISVYLFDKQNSK